MKKKILLIALMLLMVLPLSVNAKSSYKTKNLKETLKEEEITPEFSNYSENSNQITIYLFRGKGCGYCRAFLTFLNSITDEYGKYFKLVSYEVWNDKDNNKLLEEVSNFLGQPAQGVPYIIIGDQVFNGYASAYDEEIKSAITKLYKTNKSDRYDVMKEFEKSKKDSNGTSSKAVIIWNLVFIVIATSAVIVFVNFKLDKVSKDIIASTKKINKSKKE